MTRGCASDILIRWGSGWSWRVGATVSDVQRDGGCVLFQVMLDRIGISATRWIEVNRTCDVYQGSYAATYDSVSGYDPTRGAWTRVCFLSGSSMWCNPSRYVQDNW